MNTSNLVKYIAKKLLEDCHPFYTYNYEDFKRWLNEIQIKIYAPNGHLLELDSLKTDAIYKLMNVISLAVVANDGEFAWDKSYVRKRYSFSIDGCDVLHYPARNPKRMLINFSSMGKDRYDRYSRYWDPLQKWDGDTVYLFFKDDSFKYYLGDDNKPMSSTYFRIIKHFMNMHGLTPDACISVGGSMGGYAAIYYALQLSLLGAIVAAPQISKHAAQAHHLDNWSRSIRSCQSQWKDLDVFAYSKVKLPYFYIEYGLYPSDVLAVNSFLNTVISMNGLIVVRRANWTAHTVDEVLSQKTIQDNVNYFESAKLNSHIYGA